MTEEELQNTPSFRYKTKTLPLMQILDDLYGITFFRFVRVHKTLGSISIGNSLDFAFRYWNEYLDVDTTLSPQFINHQYSVKIYDGSKTSVIKKEKQMFEERLQVFKLSDKGIVILRRTENYIDTFNFSSIKYKTDEINKLLHNVINLHKYCDFFLQEIGYILKDSSNYAKTPRIIKPIFKNTVLQPNDEIISGFNNSYTEKFIREKLLSVENVRLTNAEVLCIYWYLQGKTAEETAIILNKSRRTIEGHLCAFRNKFGCFKTSAAIHQAERLGYIQNGQIYTKPNIF